MDAVTLIRTVSGLLFVTLLYVLIRKRNRPTGEEERPFRALRAWIKSVWKSWVLVACVFVVYAAIFSAAFPRANSSDLAPLVCLAATVLTVFIYNKIARRIGL